MVIALASTKELKAGMMHKPIFFYSHTSNCIDERVRVFFVPKNPQLIVYTLEHCPNCDLLKGYLKKSGRTFLERDLSTGIPNRTAAERGLRQRGPGPPEK